MIILVTAALVLAVLGAISLGNVLGWWASTGHEWRWQVLLGPWMYERARLQPRPSRRIYGMLVRIGKEDE